MKNKLTIASFVIVFVFFIASLVWGAQTLLHPSNIATTTGSAGNVLMISNGKWTPTATSTAYSQLLTFNAGFISNASSTFMATTTTHGHVYTATSTTATLSSCGTNPALTGSDQAGKIIVGTGIISSCLLTFSQSWTFPPACSANDETAILLVRAVTTVTNVTFSVATSFNSDTVSYQCSGYR